MLCPRYPGTLDLDRNPVVGERNISILEKAQSLILIVSPSIESGIEKCIPQRLLLESKESWMPLWCSSETALPPQYLLIFWLTLNQTQIQITI